jgi:hypothetical protein
MATRKNIEMKTFIVLILAGYATVAMAQPRCVKWTWYNAGKAQKVVCNQWAKR